MITDNETATSPTSETALSPDRAEELWNAVGRLIDRDYETLAPDEIADLALAVPALLPPDVRRRIVDYRRNAPNGDVLLLHGFLPEGITLPPTVEAPFAPVSGPAQTAALLLAGVMSLFGEPFTYSSLYKGRLVQNMVPVPTMEFTQTSQSSRGMLDWHVEDGFRDDRCDYAGLLCLRGDPSGASQYAQAKDLRLAPEVMATLRQTRFHVKPDPAHTLPADTPRRQIAVLTGSESAPEIIYDTHHIGPIDDADTEAADALRQLHAGLDEVRISHVMSPGDLLIFDNKRVVHARTPFTARFDGTDRWLMRVMVCASAVTFRRWGRRVPD
ncbi:TauD/TfdA family dioxygenase [Micromonospora chersina]|uniref:TauD/TfdA family dioxygenase n=1 Tax=Micromonospora chersina TaxID=47854 RepID=UPI0037BDBEB1